MIIIIIMMSYFTTEFILLCDWPELTASVSETGRTTAILFTRGSMCWLSPLEVCSKFLQDVLPVWACEFTLHWSGGEQHQQGRQHRMYKLSLAVIWRHLWWTAGHWTNCSRHRQSFTPTPSDFRGFAALILQLTHPAPLPQWTSPNLIRAFLYPTVSSSFFYRSLHYYTNI